MATPLTIDDIPVGRSVIRIDVVVERGDKLPFMEGGYLTTLDLESGRAELVSPGTPLPRPVRRNDPVKYTADDRASGAGRFVCIDTDNHGVTWAVVEETTELGDVYNGWEPAYVAHEDGTPIDWEGRL